MAPRKNNNDPSDIEDTVEFKLAMLKQKVESLERKALWVVGAAWGTVLWIFSQGAEIIKFLKGILK